MTRHTNIGSLVFLAIGIALAFLTVGYGYKVAWLFFHSAGYEPFYLIALAFAVFFVAVILGGVSAFEALTAKPGFGSTLTSVMAALSLAGAAFVYGLFAQDFTRNGESWIGPWALVFVVAAVPVILAARRALRAD